MNTPAAKQRAELGMASTENHARSQWQSMHSRDGYVAPPPYTLAEALAEVSTYYIFPQGEPNE